MNARLSIFPINVLARLEGPGRKSQKQASGGLTSSESQLSEHEIRNRSLPL